MRKHIIIIFVIILALSTSCMSSIDQAELKATETADIAEATVPKKAAVTEEASEMSTPPAKTTDNATDSETETETKTISLIEGELGNYGKTITLDGFDYINYHVPVGSYTITNNGKWCKIYLAKDDYYKNSAGYLDNDIVETLEFSNYGESKTLVVGSGEHLELTISANVTLTPID